MLKAAAAVVESPSADADSTETVEEVPYDSLFAATRDPMVIADARSGMIISANAAAAQLLGLARSALPGLPLPTMLAFPHAAKLRAGLETVRAKGVARVGNLRFRGTALDLSAGLSLVRAGTASYVLVHFSPLRNELALSERLDDASIAYEALDNGVTALVVTDGDFNVLYANRAFLQLIDVDSLHEARGHALSRWLELSTDDLSRLCAQMAAREMASTVSVRLHAQRHGWSALQALAIAVPDAEQSLWGFRISEQPQIN